MRLLHRFIVILTLLIIAAAQLVRRNNLRLALLRDMCRLCVKARVDFVRGNHICARADMRYLCVVHFAWSVTFNRRLILLLRRIAVV